MPLGISPLFQRDMSYLLSGLGVVCQVDDILVYGKHQHVHNDHHEAVLKWHDEGGLTLNQTK